MFSIQRSMVYNAKNALVSIICIYCCIMVLIRQTNVTLSESFKKIHRHEISKRNVSLLKDDLKLIINCKDRPLKMEILRYGRYSLLNNYIRGRLSTKMECSESITYTTQSDYTVLGHLPTIVERWLAPISLALYAPGYDYNATMNSIQYLRNCLPERQLIRDYVSFHIYFPTNHMPTYIARNEAEALAWPYDCQWNDIPYEFINRTDLYRTLKNLSNPINLGRNIARKVVNTYFILACDIDIYPSLGLVKQFLEIIVQDPSIILEAYKPQVFPLSVYEIDEHALLPDSKQELQEMLKTTMAAPLHYKICRNCHLVAKQQGRWVHVNNGKRIKALRVAKRYGNFSYWQPFYISDNKEPLFDERITGEGLPNKHIQYLAMCLLDYEYHILQAGFLMLSPGIKIYQNKTKDAIISLEYEKTMVNVIHNEILPQYLRLYGNKMWCKV